MSARPFPGSFICRPICMRSWVWPDACMPSSIRCRSSGRPGWGYSWLIAANQNILGFNQAQVAGAANFLKGMGASREDVNHDTRHMVHLREYHSEIGNLIKRRREIERRRANGEDVSEDEKH